MSGSVSGKPVDAARDGSGVLVLARGTGLTVERVAGGRAGAGQVITRSRRVRQARIVTSPRGSAVVVWSINGEILSSRRPTRAARFGPARVVSRHPGAAAGLRVLDPRPDGIPAVVCLVAARATPVSTARRELGCQPSGFGVGVPQLLARTVGGGSILTWSATGDPGLAAVTFARLPGSDDWSPGTLAVAGSRGGVQIEALQTVEGGRAALVTQVVDPVFPRDLARVRVVLLRADGGVVGRIDGPPTPGAVTRSVVTYLTVGSARPQGVAAWPLQTAPRRYRLSLLGL